MRILITIPHCFLPQENPRYGSQAKDPRPRLNGLMNCLSSLHQLFGKAQCQINIDKLMGVNVNQSFISDLDIIICTTKNFHLLDQLPFPEHLYKHHNTNVEPMMLGFECQAILRENLGQYDYYCYLEDDLIIHDSLFFTKLNWFTQQTGINCLLQPNRYEVSIHDLMHRVYVDGDQRLQTTEKFQNVKENPQFIGKVLNQEFIFRRALNPHSGCYFLNALQMDYWTKQAHFLDRDVSYVGPLESAASLGIMKTFNIYKPAPETANFLELQHFSTQFISLVGTRIQLPIPAHLMPPVQPQNPQISAEETSNQ